MIFCHKGGGEFSKNKIYILSLGWNSKEACTGTVLCGFADEGFATCIIHNINLKEDLVMEQLFTFSQDTMEKLLTNVRT